MRLQQLGGAGTLIFDFVAGFLATACSIGVFGALFWRQQMTPAGEPAALILLALFGEVVLLPVLLPIYLSAGHYRRVMQTDTASLWGSVGAASVISLASNATLAAASTYLAHAFSPPLSAAIADPARIDWLFYFMGIARHAVNETSLVAHALFSLAVVVTTTANVAFWLGIRHRRRMRT